MKVIRGLNRLRPKFKKRVLTIGIFDGVHLGHQRIIKQVIRQAKNINGQSLVLTFDPHPVKIFAKMNAIPLITSLEHRIELLRYLGADVCLLLDFNKEFSRMPAKKFIKDILVDTLKVDYLIIGKGFGFGKNKKGTFSLLQEASKRYGFKVRRINLIKKDGQRISSSSIRRLIQSGKINEANKFLGRYFSVYGKVREGKARGRLLGYPTANIEPEQEALPLAGVYAALVRLDNQTLPGILNIGNRPTFRAKKGLANTIEVHIFNFHKHIYGRKLEISFIQRIRSEKKFASHQALLARIKQDEVIAKEMLKAQNLST